MYAARRGESGDLDSLFRLGTTSNMLLLVQEMGTVSFCSGIGEKASHTQTHIPDELTARTTPGLGATLPK